MDSKIIGDTFFTWFGVNTVTGQGADGSSPQFFVRRAGASANDPPVYTGIPTLLVNTTFPDGSYEIAIPVTNINGFQSGNQYAVFCTLLISGVNPTGYIGSFKVSSESTSEDTTVNVGGGVIDSTVLIEAAENVAEHEVDGQRTKERSLDELIAMDKHLANRGNGSGGWGSLKTHRVVAPDGSGKC